MPKVNGNSTKQIMAPSKLVALACRDRGWCCAFHGPGGSVYSYKIIVCRVGGFPIKTAISYHNSFQCFMLSAVLFVYFFTLVL